MRDEINMIASKVFASDAIPPKRILANTCSLSGSRALVGHLQLVMGVTRCKDEHRASRTVPP
jgi:hypothetical protein